MSSRKRRTAEKPAIVPPAPLLVASNGEGSNASVKRIPWWTYVGGLLLAAFIAFEVYGPALNGEFLFDDSYLPFLMPEVQNAPLRAWLGVRPFLMISYWLNYQYFGLEPYTYHAVNVLFHILNAFLAWLIVRRMLKMAGEHGTTREILAAFGGGLFLLHPIQTESVAYVASRSETMSIFFFLAAFAVFLYRRHRVLPWGRSFVVLALFGIACTVKEHTTVLPGLLLLADFYFTTPFRLEGIRKNVKLYAPIVFGAVFGVLAVWQVLKTAQTAGFKIRDFTWYQYLFTQFRVVWTYVRLYILPVDQNGDYDYAISRTILDHGAFVGAIALAVAGWLAWRHRHDWALASFGFFGFLLLLAPTSSLVPIRDVIVERRLYLPFICLLLITVDLLRRLKMQPAALASLLSIVLVAAGIASYQRNQVWSSALAFWQDTVRKSPNNARAQFQLAYANWLATNCAEAVRGYEKVAKLQKPDDRLLVDWALALDCVKRPDDAAEKLKEAAGIAPSAHVYAQLGMVYGKNGRTEEANRALNEAEALDPRFEMIYVYRGNIYASQGDFETALGYYRHALAINPRNDTAQRALAMAEQRLRKR